MKENEILSDPVLKNAYEKFKAFCLKDHGESTENKIDADEEQDWLSLSLGFFAALDVPNEKIMDLACYCRYVEEYWC